MNIIIFTRIKSVNIKNIFFCVIDIIIFIITSQHIRGAWAPTSGHSLCIRGAWAIVLVLSTACAQVALGLLLVGQALPNAHVAFGLHWVGDKWRLGLAPDLRGVGRASGPMINGSSVRTQFYWVLPSRLNVLILLFL